MKCFSPTLGGPRKLIFGIPPYFEQAGAAPGFSSNLVGFSWVGVESGLCWGSGRVGAGLGLCWGGVGSRKFFWSRKKIGS